MKKLVLIFSMAISLVSAQQSSLSSSGGALVDPTNSLLLRLGNNEQQNVLPALEIQQPQIPQRILRAPINPATLPVMRQVYSLRIILRHKGKFLERLMTSCFGKRQDAGHTNDFLDEIPPM